MGLKLKYAFFIFTSCCFLNLKSQTNLNYFIANTTSTYDVLLSWEIDTGFSCNGTTILRSVDSINFYPIGEISGICGSSSVAQRYSFTDVSPVNFYINYYRLQLGTSGSSAIVAVYVTDPGNEKAVLFPNPLEENSMLYWDNPNNENVLIEIRNTSGILVYNSTSTESSFSLKEIFHLIGKGVFFISLSKNDQVFFAQKVIFP